MRTVPVLAVAFTILLAATAQGAVPREERALYVGSYTAFTGGTCGQITYTYAGTVCFQLDGSEETVSLRVEDATGLPVAFRYAFNVDHTPVCDGAVEDVAIPAGAHSVWVTVLGAPWNEFDCPGAGTYPGVAGEVVAQFA